MGRHAADDGAGVHPLVAAALEGRQPPETGTHRSAGAASGPTSSDGEGEPGWPGSPRDGEGGLGWPGEADARAVPAPKRSGWRRLFRSERARRGAA